MAGLFSLAIGLGLVVSLVFSELFGLAAGGMVVPGYIAMSLGRPWNVLLTVLAAAFTMGCVQAVGRVMILYGRRRTVLSILLGYLAGIAVARLAALGPHHGEGLEVIGHIVPGLLAIWMDRQGVIETVATLVTAACVVRLALVGIMGFDIPA